MDDESQLKKTLRAIDANIAEKRVAIKKGEMLKRLMKIPDFTELVLEGYLEVEAKKLFNILTDPTGLTPYTAEQTHLRLEAISHFKGIFGSDDYDGSIKVEAERAPLEILREEEYRREVTANYAAMNGAN